MDSVVTSERTATRDEVLPFRRALRKLAAEHGLTEARIDTTGTVIVHSEQPGYGPLRRFATDASAQVGLWVNVITDDVPAAKGHADPL